MKILFINKFLHANGGSETYIFKLGDYLKKQGHDVQYFGMEHENRLVGNDIGAYTSNMDFHSGSAFSKLTYPIKTIYSKEARKKLRLVLDDFCPDVCHLNNFNYQLTPSIILEIVKWRKSNNKKCKIIYTAHDYQLVCPNHSCRDFNKEINCERCLGGHYLNCFKNKCIHGSALRSAIGTAEAVIWNRVGVYEHIDKIICCSHFMKEKLDSNKLLATKTVALHNFIDNEKFETAKKKDYVLYFGRFSQEKGIKTLIEVAKKLPDIKFVFAGTGPLEEEIENVPNIKNVGFCVGDELKNLIAEARFTVYPSEWYENCPFSVMESQMYLTPVLAADIGGIPELVNNGKTGELFESGNTEQLQSKLSRLCSDSQTIEAYSKNCLEVKFDNIDEYCKKLMQIYIN